MSLFGAEVCPGIPKKHQLTVGHYPEPDSIKMKKRSWRATHAQCLYCAQVISSTWLQGDGDQRPDHWSRWVAAPFVIAEEPTLPEALDS